MHKCTFTQVGDKSQKTIICIDTHIQDINIYTYAYTYTSSAKEWTLDYGPGDACRFEPLHSQKCKTLGRDKRSSAFPKIVKIRRSGSIFRRCGSGHRVGTWGSATLGVVNVVTHLGCSWYFWA